MTVAVRLPPELEQNLRQLAERTGHSLSDCVREACVAYVADHPITVDAPFESEAYRLGKDLFGCADSGESDRSLRRKEIVHEAILKKHRARSRRSG